jgi:hypothetical protein
MVREPATAAADLNRALSRLPEVTAIYATDRQLHLSKTRCLSDLPGEQAVTVLVTYQMK